MLNVQSMITYAVQQFVTPVSSLWSVWYSYMTLLRACLGWWGVVLRIHHEVGFYARKKCDLTFFILIIFFHMKSERVSHQKWQSYAILKFTTLGRFFSEQFRKIF